MGVPVGTWTRCGNRERLDAGLLDVPIGTRAASHGAAGSHRWPGAHPELRAEAVRCVRGRFGTRWPADTAGGRVGAVARHLLRLEGVPARQPDRPTRNGDGLTKASPHQIDLARPRPTVPDAALERAT